MISRRGWPAILALLTLSLAAGPGYAEASASKFDRSELGNSALPVWSALNEFEIFAMGEAPYARAGNANALLALYLLASGDRRSMRDYRAAQNRIDRWIEKLYLSDNPRQQQRNAKQLFQGMFNEFLGSGMQAQSIPLNYHEQQSQLSVIFDNSEFNCISSSLLYVVAARKLGLNAQGVILPSHAFVQLQLNNTVVEIETTSINGFDVTHDADFYNSASGDWFSERNLAPPSFEQYQQRRIVSPYQLGLFNMINQHTADERMSFQDRMRLAELRSQLLPDDQDTRKTRLSYYYQEFFQFQSSGDFQTAARMYDQIGPFLDGVQDLPVSDPGLSVLLTAVQAQQAEALAQVGRQQESLALARALLQSRDFSGEAAPLRAHLFSLVSNYAVNRAEHDDFLGARVAYDGLESQCLQNRLCNSGLAHVYSSWAMHFVKEENWERGADIYREYLLLDDSSELSQHFSSNLERVYLQWAAGEEWRGEWEIAAALLTECTQMLNAPARCESALLKLETKYRQGYL